MNAAFKLLTVLCVVLAALPSVSAEEDATIAAARRILAERYVLPEMATKLDRGLATAEASGAFRGLRGGALAERLNAEMHKITADVHLQMLYAPDMAARLEASVVDGAAGAGRDEVLDRQLRRSNAGVRKLEVLPGNIRYLAYDFFGWGTPVANQALATAMEFLRHGDAIIIDLRNNAGGSTYAEAEMASYFLPPHTRLTRFEIRGEAGEVTETSAAPFSLAGKPMFVLIGPATVSGAEWFATHASTFGFGALVGERTRGGGYTVRFVPLPGGYVLNVSVGRALDAKTGLDLEGVGVMPGIAVGQDNALAAAQAKAMEGLIGGMSGVERMQGERLLSLYRAKVTPIAAALPLAQYTGRFGDFTIETRQNVLTIRFGEFSPEALTPVAADVFAADYDPLTQIRFVSEGGKVIALELDSGSGPALRSARMTGPP